MATWSVWPDGVVTPEGPKTDRILTVRDGCILGIRPASRQPEDAVRLPGRWILPGFVDAHSHAFQRAIRGRVQWRSGQHGDFWTWRRAMYEVAGRLSPDGVEAVSALAFLELVEAGVTRVGEFHYLHHAPDGERYADPDELAHRVIAAAQRVGLHITVLRVVYGRGGLDPDGGARPLEGPQRRFGADAPDEALDAVARLRRRYGSRAHPDGPSVSVGLAPHSVRAVPEDWLRELAAFEGVVHAHVAEQPAEVAACRAHYGGREPLAVFADAGLLTDRFTAVHLTHPHEGDPDRLRAASASVCVCPSTELDLGDGFLPLAARPAVRLCVGSDSHARVDPLGEARALELHARALAGRRVVMEPADTESALALRLLAAATVDGARALGAPAGGLAPGQPADLVALDLRRPAAAGVPPLPAMVFNGGPAWVDQVWVGGQPRLDAGRHAHRESIVRDAASYLVP